MFKTIFVEEAIQNHPRSLEIISKVNSKDIEVVESYTKIFGKVRKPYLQKRDNLNLFIAQKKGDLVKEAPPAYGTEGQKHYYFIHSYNCIYECQYCYLQGYFKSPDLVFFINHEEILKEIESISELNPNSWFHAGEFSDSLALSHITNELPLYFDFFRQKENLKLEIRTKSSNIRELKKLTPSKNIFITYSLSPATISKEIDLKTPPLSSRLMCIKELHRLGYKIGIHLDPITLTRTWEKDYKELLIELNEHIPIKDISFFSLGVVRFTKDVFEVFKQNYPNSPILEEDFITSFDQKVRYPKPIRIKYLNALKEIIKEMGNENSYLCME
ncbi:MAG: hypothetical protein CME61_01770 [Halobacteriovoraceae bacterium]|nr:hypothetical protein [Halobacteriovoraceae bacterium]|tara:strand:- start:981 stop:1967 length:987 start_codon:yes stop_codon:yes gene_type:complete